MGCCCSTPSNIDPEQAKQLKQLKQANNEIKNSMKNAERQGRSEKKLLLLGTGSSGKSTLFKSLIDIHQPFTERDCIESLHVIRQNIVAGILTLLKKSQELYEKDQSKNAPCLVQMTDDIVSAIQIIVNFGAESFTEALDYNEVQVLGMITMIVCDYAIFLCEFANIHYII